MIFRPKWRPPAKAPRNLIQEYAQFLIQELVTFLVQEMAGFLIQENGKTVAKNLKIQGSQFAAGRILWPKYVAICYQKRPDFGPGTSPPSYVNPLLMN